MWGKTRRLKGHLMDVLEHLREAGLLSQVDLKDILKHTEITIDKKGQVKIGFSEYW